MNHIIKSTMKRLILQSAALLFVVSTTAKQASIRNGEIWPDDNGQHINAHGGGMMKYGDTWYWFGENKCDTTSSAMIGVMCYSSKDLMHWENRGVALYVSDEKDSDIEHLLPADARPPLWSLEFRFNHQMSKSFERTNPPIRILVMPATTVALVARPTPSAPPCVVKPKKQA